MGFFPFTLDPEVRRYVDLDFAQIYADPATSQYDTKQCLISSLEHYGVSSTVLGEIGRTFRNFAIHVPRKCFKWIGAGLCMQRPQPRCCCVVVA